MRVKRRRKGAVLVLFVLIAFCIFGIAALVLDMGFAMLARRQMQAAVDTAALEGLRQRGNPGSVATDTARRNEARALASRVFAADLSDDAEPILGAGPEYDFTDVRPDLPVAVELQALQQLSNPRHFQPDLQTNVSDGTAGNEPNGDMVSGEYLGPPATMSSEDDAYVRNDFEPAEPADAATANAFLVRMRRTQDIHGGDRNASDNEPGVSSTGKAIPFLLGRGSLIHRDPMTNYSPRRDGISVRANAIADLRPARSVGASSDVNGIPGFTPVALREWPDASAMEYTIHANGSIIDRTEDGNEMSDVGRVIRATTLDLACSQVDGQIQVVSDDGFPFDPAPTEQLPSFVIGIDDELLRVTGKDGNLWDVERGILGSTAAPHSEHRVVFYLTHLSVGEPLVDLFGPESMTTVDDRRGVATILPERFEGILGHQPLWLYLPVYRLVSLPGDVEPTPLVSDFVRVEMTITDPMTFTLRRLEGASDPPLGQNASGFIMRPLHSRIDAAAAETLFAHPANDAGQIKAAVLVRSSSLRNPLSSNGGP